MSDLESGEVEALAERIHKVYCQYHMDVRGFPYWTNGDYSKLEENTKEADRYMARFMLNEIATIRAEGCK